MDKTDFIDKVGKLLDVDCHYGGSGNRIFTDTEKASFLSHLWDFCEPEGDMDYQSPIFILALQKVQQKYRSIQDQAAHLDAAIAEEVALVKARQSIKMPTP